MYYLEIQRFLFGDTRFLFGDVRFLFGNGRFLYSAVYVWSAEVHHGVVRVKMFP